MTEYVGTIEVSDEPLNFTGTSLLNELVRARDYWIVPSDMTLSADDPRLTFHSMTKGPLPPTIESALEGVEKQMIEALSRLS